MKKICCFCECWESGGIESFLTNVLSHMDLTEIEIDLVAECIKESVFTPQLNTCGIRFVELSGRQRSPRNLVAFRNLLRERKYDVVHLNIFHGLSLQYAAIAKKEGVPCRIAHSHNASLHKSKIKWLKLMIHHAAKQVYSHCANHYWACSSDAADFMFQKGTAYIFIPNGINIERFKFDAAVRNDVRKDLGLKDTFVIGNVGRLCYQKNQDFLLDVFAEVVKHKPESCLLLVGEGEQEVYLKEKAKKLGIAEKVIFYGVTDCVERLLWAMDVFAFPSRFEGLGIAAIEAQAAGLPVLCSDQIPREAYILPTAKSLSLKDTPFVWARSLLEHNIKNENRANCAFVVQTKDFCVKHVAKQIEAMYLAESREKV